MKIAWLTPFSRQSGISKYSQSITNELINWCDVDLWVSEDVELLPTGIDVFHYHAGEDLSRRLSHYDFIVYNMGNNYSFHKGIYEASKQIPGIVILHDIIMHHFFSGYYLLHKLDKNEYVRNMELLYGEHGRNVAIDIIQGKCSPIWETEEVIKYPFFDKAITGADGVIVHSHYSAQKVKQRFLGPVGVMYHPYTFDASKGRHNKRKAVLRIPKDKILIITIGHVNSNKRIDRVIKILGTNKDLAEKVLYLVIGTHGDAQYYAQLQALVEKYDLKNVVNFLGFQPDKVLYAYMSNADIFINLRFPAIEGASWSLVEQLYYGKPVIVTDVGFYSELPDDCVIKIGVDREEAELLSALNKLIFEDKIRKGIGAKGRQFAMENFSAQKYAQSFIDFLDRVKYWKPVLELVDKVSVELNVMGETEDIEVIDRAAQEIYKICGHIDE